MVRKHNGADLLPRQITLLREELWNIADNDLERIAIAKKAASGNWSSFYQTGKRAAGGRPAKKKNQFNNFKQRDYDYSSLEAQLLGAGNVERNE